MPVHVAAKRDEIVKRKGHMPVIGPAGTAEQIRRHVGQNVARPGGTFGTERAPMRDGTWARQRGMLSKTLSAARSHGLCSGTTAQVIKT